MSSINFGHHAPNCILTIDSSGFSDGRLQWRGVSVKANTGAFQGQTGDYITIGQLEQLSTELESLYQSLKGKIEFGTLEDRFVMELIGDGMGHILLKFRLYDEIARLEFFSGELDQTFLPELINEVKETIAEYFEENK